MTETVGLSDTPIQVKAPASVTRRACFRQLVGAWAIEDTALSGYVEQLRGMDMETVWAENRKLGDYPIYSPAAFGLMEDLQASGHEVDASVLLDDGEDERRGPPPYVRVGSTAVIPVSGPLSKHPSSLSHRFGGSSTAGMRQALQVALGDKKVERVMFHIDSPGGTVAGTGDLGDDIARANAVKPTAAYVEDLGASAALWIASQTGHIYASRHSEVGSIGVIQVVHDTSKMAEKAGIEVHVIKSGPYKGGPVPGTKVTEAQKKEMQSTISTIHGEFVRTVAEGRGLSVESVASIADGRVFQAPRAKELGLVDTISTFSGALSDFATLSVLDVQRRTGPPPPEVIPVASINANDPANPVGDNAESVGESQRQRSNRDDHINTSSQVPSMTEPTPSEDPAAQAPRPAAGEEGAGTARILAAIEAQGKTIEALSGEVQSLKDAQAMKESAALDAKKDEAIALGIDEALVDECASTAEVDRLVKVSGLAHSPSTRGAPGDKKTEEETEPLFSVAKAYQESGGNPHVIHSKRGGDS